jgi:hypothetical protein
MRAAVAGAEVLSCSSKRRTAEIGKPISAAYLDSTLSRYSFKLALDTLRTEKRVPNNLTEWRCTGLASPKQPSPPSRWRPLGPALLEGYERLSEGVDVVVVIAVPRVHQPGYVIAPEVKTDRLLVGSWVAGCLQQRPQAALDRRSRQLYVMLTDHDIDRGPVVHSG